MLIKEGFCSFYVSVTNCKAVLCNLIVLRNSWTGCKNCANVACDVFEIEEDFGRARVYSQFGNPDLVQQAIDSWYFLILWLWALL